MAQMGALKQKVILQFMYYLEYIIYLKISTIPSRGIFFSDLI